MSLVSALLSQRVVATRVGESYTTVGEPERARPTITTLADLRSGCTARIIAVCDAADAATARRLFDLGFAPGAEVQVVRRAPLSDPAIVRIAGYEIALRRAQARCIQVTLPA